VVEELLPALVALMAEVDVDEGVVSGPDGLFNKLHPGVFGSSASFFYVALGAGANNIFPGCFAAHASGDDVVER
jgi:hypothetical protein